MDKKNTAILFGIDNLCTEIEKYKNIRFGLVTNNAAKTTSGILSRQALLQAGFNIVKLFSPEHGLSAKGADGFYQPNSIDELTQLPIISLYGNRLKPTQTEMADLDAILFDIPDIGARFYTYLWTMTYMMQTCAQYNISLIILDRPNPQSGDLEKAEGPMLDETECSSFIGRWNIPVRHSCTLGELANYFAATRIKGLDLSIIKLKNWNRDNSVAEVDWGFTPTSPAIKNVETALLYPGMGLLEGINVNEGRGTDNPFKMFGAPWIDAQGLHEGFQDSPLQGIESMPIIYTPAWGIYQKEECNGLQLVITNEALFRPVATGIFLVKLIAELYPENLEERLYPTVANPTGAGHFDKLTGVPQTFEKIKEGKTISTDLLKDDWMNIIQPYLLY